MNAQRAKSLTERIEVGHHRQRAREARKRAKERFGLGDFVAYMTENGCLHCGGPVQFIMQKGELMSECLDCDEKERFAFSNAKGVYLQGAR